jgi:hypothetical protein
MMLGEVLIKFVENAFAPIDYKLAVVYPVNCISMAFKHSCLMVSLAMPEGSSVVSGNRNCKLLVASSSSVIWSGQALHPL